MLVPRFPKQLNLVLVRIEGSNIPAGTKCKKHVLLPAHIFLHVVEPPVVTNHPQDLKNVVPGKPVMFSAQATGTQPLSYHWEWNDYGKWQPCDMERVSGADSTTLTVPSVHESNEGSYRCVVSNCAGSQTSNPAELSVGKNPMFKGMECVYCIMGILYEYGYPTGRFESYKALGSHTHTHTHRVGALLTGSPPATGDNGLRPSSACQGSHHRTSQHSDQFWLCASVQHATPRLHDM